MHRVTVFVIIVGFFCLSDCLKKHGNFDDAGFVSLKLETNEVGYDRRIEDILIYVIKIQEFSLTIQTHLSTVSF